MIVWVPGGAARAVAFPPGRGPAAGARRSARAPGAGRPLGGHRPGWRRGSTSRPPSTPSSAMSAAQATGCGSARMMGTIMQGLASLGFGAASSARGGRPPIRATCPIRTVRTTALEASFSRMRSEAATRDDQPMTSQPASAVDSRGRRHAAGHPHLSSPDATARGRAADGDTADPLRARAGRGPAAPATFAVLSDLDLARAAGNGALDDVTAGDIAGSPLITISPDATLQTPPA